MVAWPAWLPNLNLLKFFLWCRMKCGYTWQSRNKAVISTVHNHSCFWHKKLNSKYPVGINNGVRLGSPHAVTKGDQFE